MRRPLANREYDPWCMLLIEDDIAGAADQVEVLAYLVIPTKLISHAGREYLASGLSSVSTRVARRGQGHAGRLVRAAFARIAASDVDLAVFTCDEPLGAFYESCGFTRMPSTVVVGGTRERPFRADALVSPEGHRKVTLMAAVSDAARSRWSDFANSDVYLELREGDLW